MLIKRFEQFGITGSSVIHSQCIWILFF